MLDYSVFNKSGLPKAIFTVPLRDQPSVYMAFDLKSHMSDTWAAVIVDATKFLELWRNEKYSIHKEISMGDTSTWQNDRKYPRAEKGFQMGIDNPVPLAYVIFDMKEHHHIKFKYLCFGKTVTSEKSPSVGYIDGITRTIWLLSNGCNAFPIKCKLPGAEDLNKYAGVEGGTVLKICDLLENIVYV